MMIFKSKVLKWNDCYDKIRKIKKKGVEPYVSYCNMR